MADFWVNAATGAIYTGDCQPGDAAATDAQVAAMQAAQAAAQAVPLAIAAGVTVTSTSTPALNGNYACDAEVAGVNLTGIVSGLSAGLGLPGGGSTMAYLDMAGQPHMFTAAQITELASAVRNYIYALDLYAAGQGALPSPNITIP